MLEDIVTGFVSALIGKKLFGKWSRRHPYMTMAICIPPLAALAVATVWVLLRN